MIEFGHNGTDVKIGFSGVGDFAEWRQDRFRRDEQSIHLAVSLNGSVNKVRILSHQCVPKSMNFEQVLKYAKKPHSTKTPTKSNQCIIC